MKILVLGCGNHQIHGIISLYQNGHEIYGVDKNPHSVAKDKVNHFINISVHDSEKIINYLIKNNIFVDLVISLGVEASISAATISNKFNLPYTSKKSAELSTDKYLRLKKFKEFDVRTPNFIVYNYKNLGNINFPIIIKQKTGAGSRGVRIVDNKNNFDSIYSSLLSTINDEIIIEEYVEGTEHSIEGYVDFDGEVNWIIVSDRRYQDKWKYFPKVIDDGDDLPSKLPKSVIKKIMKESTKAVRSLGVSFGPVKGDIIVKNNIPYVIEMATRFSGDYFCTSVSELFLGKSVLNQFVSYISKIDSNSLKSYSRVSFFYYWINKKIQIKSISFIMKLRSKSFVGFARFEPKFNTIKVGDIIFPEKSSQDKFLSIAIVNSDDKNIEDLRLEVFDIINKDIHFCE